MKTRVLSIVLIAVATGGCAKADSTTVPWPPVGAESRFVLDSETEADCTAEDAPLTPGGPIGPLRPGGTLADLRSSCDSIQPGWVILEGIPVPAVMTRVGGVQYLAELSDTMADARVYRISTSDPQARTTDGVGPGLTVAQVGAIWPDIQFAAGEGVFALSPSNPGISLNVLVHPRFSGLSWSEVDADEFRAANGGTAQVLEVLIVRKDH